MLVHWDTTIKTQFTVGNVVKQGGIISPISFDVYLDDTSLALHSSNIGEYLDAVLNHLCYANNLCLIISSSCEMQQLLKI